MSDRAYNEIADEVVVGIYEAYPELLERYGDQGKKKCHQDNLYHMQYLESAYVQKQVDVFTEYAVWLNRVLTARGMKAEHLIDNYERIRKALPGKLDPDKEQQYTYFLTEAIRALRETQ